jgi:hypothetical protein
VAPLPVIDLNDPAAAADFLLTLVGTEEVAR